MVDIRITSERSEWKIAGKEAERILERSLFFLKKKNCSLNLFLVTTSTMRRLNRIFRGKDAPTNVLSFEWQKEFPHPDEKRRTRYLGEIFIAPTVARRRGDHPPLLVVHGLLHLLGYTHKRVRDRIKMERTETRLLKRISPEYVFKS